MRKIREKIFGPIFFGPHAVQKLANTSEWSTAECICGNRHRHE